MSSAFPPAPHSLPHVSLPSTNQNGQTRNAASFLTSPSLCLVVALFQSLAPRLPTSHPACHPACHHAAHFHTLGMGTCCLRSPARASSCLPAPIHYAPFIVPPRSTRNRRREGAARRTHTMSLEPNSRRATKHPSLESAAGRAGGAAVARPRRGSESRQRHEVSATGAGHRRLPQRGRRRDLLPLPALAALAIAASRSVGGLLSPRWPSPPPAAWEACSRRAGHRRLPRRRRRQTRRSATSLVRDERYGTRGGDAYASLRDKPHA